jgi:hypothetical protein
MRRKNETFGKREIAIAINNAFQMALRPSSGREVTEERLRRLRNYAQALLEPLGAEIEEEYITPEEGVVIALAGALFVHQRYVSCTEKIPAVKISRELLEKR